MSELDSVLFKVLVLRQQVHSTAKDDSRVLATLSVLDAWPVNHAGDMAYHVNLMTYVQPGQQYECRFTMALIGNAANTRDLDKALRVQIDKWRDWLDKETTIEPKWKPLIVQAWEGFYQ